MSRGHSQAPWAVDNYWMAISFTPLLPRYSLGWRAVLTRCFSQDSGLAKFNGREPRVQGAPSLGVGPSNADFK